jgi:protein-glutamine gamma-glutamyltransferase
MTLALLHRRLACLMALAALAAFAAGAGMSAGVALAAAGLVVALVWQPGARAAGYVERGVWLASIVLFLRVFDIALRGGDILPPLLALLLTLLVGEALRGLEAQNDLRLHSLGFALMIAATAFYPGLSFAVAFAAYIALTTLALMVGHLRRQTERHAVAEARVRRGFLALTAGLSLFTVLFSVVVFAAFPRMPRSWLGQARVGAGATMAGFSDEVSLGQHGGRIRGNPEVVFRVEFPEGTPESARSLYWRGRSFDHFDGSRWSRSSGVPPADLPRGAYLRRWGWTSPLLVYRVYGGPPGAQVLFGVHPVLEVRTGSAVRPAFGATGDIELRGADVPVYTGYSVARRPSDTMLRGVPEAGAPAGRTYLQLPPLGAAVIELSDSLTRGHATRFDRVRAVERWLQQEFRYTLELPRSAREATLEAFLRQRRAGHCEYFSTAMVVMLRAAGIPARNVTGFLGGEWSRSGGYLAVTGNQAHSWVEVWFPELGWVPFDPTPAAGRDGVLGGAPAGRLWPLRLWADGLQHGWYKWVLDYDPDKQALAFQRLRDLVSGRGGRADAARLPRSAPGWLLLGAVAGLGAAGLLIARPRLRLRRARPSTETRHYRALRRVYGRAGYDLGAATAPLATLAEIRRLGAPAADEAEALVQLYLAARFGGHEIGAEGRARMALALARVRRALRGRRMRRLALPRAAAR